jgi:hypothetical protein
MASDWPIAAHAQPIREAPDTRMRVVASDPEYNLYQARLSPDGRWVCFNAVKASEAGASTIFVAPAAGGEWRRLTEGKYLDIKQRWAPNGRAFPGNQLRKPRSNDPAPHRFDGVDARR